LAPAVGAYLDLYAPDVEIDVSALDVPGLEVFRGLSGLREMSARWIEEWERLSWTGDNWDEFGEHVLVDAEVHATGRSSGAEVVWTTSHVWTFRDGKVIRWRQFRDRAAALIAVGR
jgi:ketosteroid isomerase-like protein